MEVDAFLMFKDSVSIVSRSFCGEIKSIFQVMGLAEVNIN